MLVVFDLFYQAIQSVKELKIGRVLDLEFDLVQNWDLITANNHAIKLILLQFGVPRMLLYVRDFESFLWINLHYVLHHILRLLVNVAWHQIVARKNLLIQLIGV